MRRPGGTGVIRLPFVGPGLAEDSLLLPDTIHTATLGGQADASHDTGGLVVGVTGAAAVPTFLEIGRAQALNGFLGLGRLYALLGNPEKPDAGVSASLGTARGSRFHGADGFLDLGHIDAGASWVRDDRQDVLYIGARVEGDFSEDLSCHLEGSVRRHIPLAEGEQSATRHGAGSVERTETGSRIGVSFIVARTEDSGTFSGTAALTASRWFSGGRHDGVMIVGGVVGLRWTFGDAPAASATAATPAAP